MNTTKLYYENAYTRRFTAQVTACEPVKGGYHVQLDQTAFFPEGGGQTADTGTLDSVRVLDCHEKGGEIYHFTDAPLTVGQTVTGLLDWHDRFRKMQNHTGEHIVSGLVHARYGFENVGFHLAENGCTFDFDGELTRQQLDELEQAANAIVWENRPVTTAFPSSEELASLTYRSKLDLTENVRLVTVEGVDVCACCAPHVSRTGEIGIIKLLDFMRHRGGVRIWAKCGWDALQDYDRRYTASAAISGLLNTPQESIVSGVEKLLAQRDSLKQELTTLQRQALEAQAASLAPTEGNYLLFPQTDNEGMRLLANALLEKCGGVCALFSGQDGAYQFVLASRTQDMRSFLKENQSALQARGGGQTQMVSGRSTAAKADLEAFFGA
jgi:alanyl-tRNA synthetase